MPCYHPLAAWRDLTKTDPKTGKHPIVFHGSDLYEPISVPCGQCIGCRLERSRQWAMRCVHEASLYKQNCFITLTFADEHLAPDGSLHLEDFQKFMKRFRKKFSDVTIRFFHCGEYGTLNLRPHHHAIIFNFDFHDKYLWKVYNGINYYRSPTLEKLWPFGMSTIGDVTFESAAYVARYCVKKFTGDLAAMVYDGLKPEYCTMSRRPGIGREWFLKFKNDVFPSDRVVIRSDLIVKPSKYYDKLYDILDHDAFEVVKTKRKLSALKSTLKALPVWMPIDTRAKIASGEAKYTDLIRLSVKSKVKASKLKQLIRPIEM